MLNYQLIPTDTNCNVPIHVVLPGSQARFPRQASHMASKAASALKDNLAKPQEIKAWVPQNFHRNLEPWNHGVWLSIEFPEEFPYGHRILFPSPEFPYLPLSGIIFYPRFGNRSYPYCILPVMAGQQIPSLMVYHFRDVQNKKSRNMGHSPTFAWDFLRTSIQDILVYQRNIGKTCQDCSLHPLLSWATCDEPKPSWVPWARMTWEILEIVHESLKRYWNHNQQKSIPSLMML